MGLNNDSIVKPAYTLESRASGITGHVEFTRYADGSHEVKEYPGLGHRLFDSVLYQDLDGLVDRIRKNGSELKMNSLSELLVREHDYDANASKFNEADTQLQNLMSEYAPRN